MKKWNYLKYLLFFLFCNIGLQAKSVKDSLINIIENSKPDTNKVLAMMDLVYYYAQRINDSTLIVGNETIDLSKKLSYPNGISFSLIEMGRYHHNSRNYKKGLEYFHQALYVSKSQQVKKQLPFVYLNLATSYRRMAKQDSAFFYYTAAEKAFDAINNPYKVWQVYFGLGVMYYQADDFERAQPYLEKALSYVKEKNRRMDLGYVLFHMGEFYFSSKNYDAYRKNAEAWHEFNAKGKPSVEESSPKHAVYFSFFSKNDSLSVKWLEQALDSFTIRKDTLGISWGYQNLGYFYNKINQKDKTYETYQKGLEFMLYEKDYPSIVRAYGKLYELSKDKGNYEEALSFLEKYTYLRDSIQSIQVENNLRELEIKYETEKKEQQIQVQDLMLQQRTLQRNALFGSSIFLVVLAFLVFFGLRSRIRINSQLASQQMEIKNQRIFQLQQEKRLLAYSSMIEGQETERMRIAADLHDGIGSLLTTIKAHLSSLRPLEQPKYTAIHQKTNHLIDETCSEVRRIAQNMIPKALLISGLDEAIEDLTINLRRNGLNCHLEIVGMKNELSQHQSVMIYRIIQELTNNILKHAGAKNVLLQLIQDKKDLSIIIEDDGKGFNLNEAMQKKSVGLKSITSRVEVLDGEINIDTVEKEGTTVTIRIPTQIKQYA